MFNPRGAQVTKELRHVLIHNVPRGLQFCYQLVFNKQIGIEISQERSIFVKHLERVLLLYFETLFTQAVCERILVNLLDMPATMVTMNRISGFTHDVRIAAL